MGASVGQLSLIPPDTGFDRSAIKLVSDVIDRGTAALESVRLHQAVQRQALTDETTDLANRRLHEDDRAGSRSSSARARS